MRETNQATMHHTVTMPRTRAGDGLSSPMKAALDENKRVLAVLAEDGCWVHNDQLVAWVQQVIDLHYAQLKDQATKEAMRAFIDAARDPANPFHEKFT